MSLGAPWMLLLMPLVVLAGWLMARARRLCREAACRLKGVAPENRPGSLNRPDWLALAALALVVLALAQPQWNPRPYDVERRGRDLVIALDVSRSMLAADVFPSRLETARIAIHEALPALNGQRVALVTFAGSASVRVPLTLDHGFVRYMLERADPSEIKTGSTSLKAAFEKAAHTVLTDATAGARDLIVFTDGEDHLSSFEETAEALGQCGAKVLIVGLGDPVRGARVPDVAGDGQWMRYNGVEVISRLDESMLTRLADTRANVTYFPARTRPFDLVPLYRRLIAGAGEDTVVGGLRRIRYDQGYPYLLAVAVVLWLASSSSIKPRALNLIVLALLASGCAGRVEKDGDAAFRARFERGDQLLGMAREQADADEFAERSLLTDAREEFLLAALSRPGHLEAARRITTITRRLGELATLIEKRQEEDRQRGAKLDEMVRRLEKLAARQRRLSQRSQRVLQRRRVPTGEAANLPESMIDPEQFGAQSNFPRLAKPLLNEQRDVRGKTKPILDGVTRQRDTLRQLLSRAYGNVGKTPDTEIDPIVNLLTETVTAQDQALASLAPAALRWPAANTALHVAAGRMEQALEALRGLQPPGSDADNNSMSSPSGGDFDETVDGPDSKAQEGPSQPVSPGDFEEALSLRSLPIPDYTAAEILAEEAENQRKRAQRNAARSGANVEKNW